MSTVQALADSGLRGRNLLRIADLSPEEIVTILSVADGLKRSRAADHLPLLRGKTLGMLFEKPSLRTRVSFEVGMTQLGGHALIAHGSDFMVGARETPEDAARVLSRFVDAIVVRTHAHEPLERFAAAATVPVVNACTTAPLFVSISAVASRTSMPVIRLISCRSASEALANNCR